MFSLASEEIFSDGQVIFKEGSSGDWVYVILSGSVEIFKTIDGKKSVIEVLEKGEIFGEIGFIGGVNRTASATAIGETILGVIDRAFLDVDFNKLSSDFRTILVAMVRRFKKMIDRASDFSSRTGMRMKRTLSLSYKDARSFLKAYSDNISTGGLFIKTEKPLKQGEVFLLKLQLPGLSAPMQIKCEVMWTKIHAGDGPDEAAGMGVRFCEMDQKDKQTLTRYIKKLLKDKE